jgi:predicted RNA-binding Zn-ribbon protein involved in translation (DUF1610 family)
MRFRFLILIAGVFVFAFSFFGIEQMAARHLSERTQMWAMAIFGVLYCVLPFLIVIWKYRRIQEQQKTKMKKVAGFCIACGYNLRGITSARCPECGVVRASLSENHDIA